MSHYVHHVPGRLRIRSRAFRCDPDKARALERDLPTLEGVQAARYNERNGSLTIQYDPASGVGDAVLGALSNAGCLALSPAEAGTDGGIVSAFGKAVVTAVAQQAVARSFSSLAAVLR